MNLLQAVFSVLLIVFREAIFDSFLQFLLDIRSNITYLNLGTLAYFVALLHQVATSFLSRLRQIKANQLTIVLWCDTNI